jgi:hypothetical protein
MRRSSGWAFRVAAVATVFCGPVRATESGSDGHTVSEVVVTASRVDLTGIAVTASQGAITQEELKLRPAYRVGQYLESVPGLVVTVHSGEGKAYQYLARGFNLDHGTDIANFIDGIPVNRSTNAHGQGYSDLNFLIPETLGGLQFTKGTYYPAIGDFGAVASVHLQVADEIPDQIRASAGTLGDESVFVGGSRRFAGDNRLMAGAEYSHVDGPFDPGNDFKKYAGIVRFSHGSATDGYDLTAMYYKGDGLFTTDQPLRAVQRGLISRFGTLDPTDGNRSERLSLSGHYATEGDHWSFTSNAYYVRSRQTLFNNFTHFLEDPVNGDQEQQDETRDLAGGALAFTYDANLGAITSNTTIGVQGRYDGLYVDRRHTRARKVLDYCESLAADGTVTPYSIGNSACTANLVQLHDIGVYAENSARFTPWLRTDIGLREEFYGGTDQSLIPGTVFSTVPFSQNVTLFQPKGSVALGPWSKTEIYLSAGRGFHSDDIRGVSGTVPLEGIPGTGAPSSLLVRADGEEVGVRSGLIPHTQIQLALFNINLQSELVYDQDQGLDQPGPPSVRDGVEFSAQYRPFPWLEVNTDLSFSHARFDLADRAALFANYGNSETYIPNAPDFVGSFGILVDNLGHWYGGLQVRVLGSYPLVSDNSERDAGYTETNVDVGYKVSPNLRVQAEVFNLFDVKANAGAYYYTTVIPGDGGVPTADHQNHPLEPFSARVSVTAFF